MRERRITPAQPVACRYKYKVDAALAQEMRERRSRNESMHSIARALGLDRSTVRHWTTRTNYLPRDWVTREEAAHA